MFGEVVGITSAALTGGENLNFAVPINDAKKLMKCRPRKLFLPFLMNQKRQWMDPKNLHRLTSLIRHSQTPSNG